MPKKVSKHKTAKRKVTKRKVAKRKTAKHKATKCKVTRRGGVQRDAVVQNAVNYEAVFKSIRNTLRSDDGCSNAIEYIEQSSWILFLKYLHDYETNQETTAKGLKKSPYKRIIKGHYRWDKWAAPLKADGSLDRKASLVGDDLIEFVNDELFPHLQDLKNDDAADLEYKIGEIFAEIKNRMQNGNLMREVIDKVNSLTFLGNANMHELSRLYENGIEKMGDAGQNGGEYYTPRPLIQSIVKVVNPQIGETVYDGAAGSAGFLCEAYEWIRSKNLTTTQYKKLQTKTFYGKEKKILAFVIANMNMILHGVKVPHIVRGNTLEEDVRNISDKEKFDVVLANPPFGGIEHSSVQHNFFIPTGETAYLFLQHFFEKLKDGGRCGIVITNSILSGTSNAEKALRKQLINDCDLFAVLALPRGVFANAGVQTVVLFFRKANPDKQISPTKKIWYYQLNVERNLGKKHPLDERDLAEFVKLATTRKKSKNSWLVNVDKLDKKTFDLTVKNPNRVEYIDVRTPAQIIADINKLDAQANKALHAIKGLT